MKRGATITEAGLSPRVRGNHLSGHGRRPWHGSIPACAGEPSASVRRSIETRSIPACAGEPSRDPPGCIGAAVYPRVCGGTDNTDRKANPDLGLSPRVRGNLNSELMSVSYVGSIPACAGEPEIQPRRRSGLWVYPRVCGGTIRTKIPGSPGRGSIPACAGEPDAQVRRPSSIEVYPRVCGGTKGCMSLIPSSKGLSPRVRGNPIYIRRLSDLQGSIPACAGEPPMAQKRYSNIGVYPRVCGGTVWMVFSIMPRQGLSPRVRGNPLSIISCVISMGSIPACAGEPRRQADPEPPG